MKYQLANYSSGSFTWSSKSIQLNFVGILKRCEKKNGAAERFTAEQVAPSDFDENEYETPSDFDENDYETKVKAAKKSLLETFKQLQGSSRCAECRWPHVVQLSLPLQASCPLHEP